MCARARNGVGDAQSGIAPCENDLLPVSLLSNGLLFSDVWKSGGDFSLWGLRGVEEFDMERLNEVNK